MAVHLNENGSATFTAHVEITSGADRLRNATLRDTIVRDVGYTLVEDRQHLRTAMHGTTLTVTYLGTDVAHRTLGVLRFDAFVTRDPPPFASGGEGTPYPGADTLTLHPPTGYRLHGSYGDVSNETAVVWHGNSHEEFAGDIAEDVVISFVPRDAPLPNLRVWIAGLLDRVRSLGSTVQVSR